MSQAADRPMPMAEFDDCCGQYRTRVGVAFGDIEQDVENYCENCPLLIERKREQILRVARAL